MQIGQFEAATKFLFESLNTRYSSFSSNEGVCARINFQRLAMQWWKTVIACQWEQIFTIKHFQVIWTFVKMYSPLWAFFWFHCLKTIIKFSSQNSSNSPNLSRYFKCHWWNIIVGPAYAWKNHCLLRKKYLKWTRQ